MGKPGCGKLTAREVAFFPCHVAFVRSTFPDERTCVECCWRCGRNAKQGEEVDEVHRCRMSVFVEHVSYAESSSQCA